MGLTRRRFFQALAASVVAAGVTLPIGMPTKWDVAFQKPWRFAFEPVPTATLGITEYARGVARGAVTANG